MILFAASKSLNKTPSLFLGIFILFFALTVRAEIPDDIRAGHAFQQAQSLEAKVLNLAIIMGIALESHTVQAPSNIYPRDVFYQGLTVHKKMSRIRYEFTRMETNAPKDNDDEYQPKHVHALMLNTHEIANDILGHLYKTYTVTSSDADEHKMEAETKLPKLDLNKHPKDVYVKLVAINRKLNQLLDFEFSPADTFEQVTHAISYASAILQTISNEQTVFDPEPLQFGKTPGDVYERLQKVQHKLFVCLRAIGMMTIQVPEESSGSRKIEPSDVYDLSTLVLSNLAFLHRNLKQHVRPRPTYYPGKIIPSAVYQRASILEKQVDNIHRLRHGLKMK